MQSVLNFMYVFDIPKYGHILAVITCLNHKNCILTHTYLSNFQKMKSIFISVLFCESFWQSVTSHLCLVTPMQRGEIDIAHVSTNKLQIRKNLERHWFLKDFNLNEDKCYSMIILRNQKKKIEKLEHFQQKKTASIVLHKPS